MNLQVTPKSKAVLITQCLQNDFVKPIGQYQPMPNRLHVGYSESKRLLGERPADGPVQRVMEWAYDAPESELAIINIRDWHDALDEKQTEHLRHFGRHCIAGTDGADFVFESTNPELKGSSRGRVVNASGLNDFVDTNLEKLLEPYKDDKVKVGLAGVWTEAKLSFLAYELVTRYPGFELAICSALSASSSRAAHFIALDRLQSLLGIKVVSSVSAFCEFLTGDVPAADDMVGTEYGTKLKYDGEINKTDILILKHLYRDCKEVELKILDGGFSGNLVLKGSGVDLLGHPQVPSVVKIGDRDPIAKERESFERIQEVLGNVAPHIVDFAEVGERGGIKYRYASMSDEQVFTFQDRYETGAATETELKQILDTVFKRQLGRLYKAAQPEKTELLEYWMFASKWADSIAKKTDSLPFIERKNGAIHVHGKVIPDVVDFYRQDLAENPSIALNQPMAYVHGDLNGKNIIIDAGSNVWLIDFFHTHRGHVLRDLIKLENDILFIFMKIETEAEWLTATGLVDALVEHSDLRHIPELPDFEHPEIQKAAVTICHLRTYYKGLIGMMRDPIGYRVAMLRYAMHTLSFDESNLWQRKLALYMGGRAVEFIREHLALVNRLRLDFINLPGRGQSKNGTGGLALTILPGRKDWKHDLAQDIETIKEADISAVVVLVTQAELEQYGVPGLIDAYQTGEMEIKHLPIQDQSIPNHEDAKETVAWIESRLRNGKSVLMHCVGGLGRSGTIGAALLVEHYGYGADEAIEQIRQDRSRRAVETKGQEAFVHDYAKKKLS